MAPPAATTARSRSCALFRFAGRVSCGKGGTFSLCIPDTLEGRQCMRCAGLDCPSSPGSSCCRASLTATRTSVESSCCTGYKTTSQVRFQGVDSSGIQLLDAGRHCTQKGIALHAAVQTFVCRQQVDSTDITPHDALMHDTVCGLQAMQVYPFMLVDSHHHSGALRFTWASLHSSSTSCSNALTMPSSSCRMTTVMPLNSSLSVGSSKASASSCKVCLCGSAADWGSEGAESACRKGSAARAEV